MGSMLSCHEVQQKSNRQGGIRELNESLIKANQLLLRNEEARIDSVIAIRQWPMKVTGSGLRYWIYEDKQGVQPADGNTVILNYTIQLLNGENLYTSVKDGPMTICLGKDAVITGLEEGIFLMQQGDKAKFIIPSHLGFGLAGDDKKVPKKATLIYDVHLVSVK